MTEPELLALMRDPRYWRDRDPALVLRVQGAMAAMCCEPPPPRTPAAILRDCAEAAGIATCNPEPESAAMNIAIVRTTAPAHSDAFTRAAHVCQADTHIGAAMDALGDALGDLFRHRCTLAPAERRAEAAMRDALVALAHARNLVAPHMSERV
jgi:hypothetical protein